MFFIDISDVSLLFLNKVILAYILCEIKYLLEFPKFIINLELGNFNDF